MFLPVLVAAPWALVDPRADARAPALHRPALAARVRGAQADDDVIWLALPLLVVWANVHGSVALGALLVMLLARVRAGPQSRRDLAAQRRAHRPRAARRPRDAVRPDRDGPLLPPPARRPAVRRARDRVALGGPGDQHDVLLRARGDRGRARVARAPPPHGLRLRRPRAHLRGRRERDPRDRLVRARVHGLRPGRDRPQAREQEPGRAAPEAERRDRGRAHRRASSPSPARCSLRDETWFEEYWPREAVEAVRGELRPDDRVFAPDRFSDWMLFKIPELRGRVAYDVRFELYDREFFDELQDYAGESTPDWKSFADGYRIVIVDETPQVAHFGLPRGAGRARRLPRTTRSRSSPGRGRLAAIAGGTRARPRARTPSPRPDRVRAGGERPHDLGMPREDRRAPGSRPTDRRGRRRPTSPRPRFGTE